MERNRRIAKAYARKRAITVNGSDDDYLDGTTLGLNSFENPDRDSKTSNIKQYIGEVSDDSESFVQLKHFTAQMSSISSIISQGVSFRVDEGARATLHALPCKRSVQSR